MEVVILYNPPKMIIVPYKNICFVGAKETSPCDVSFAHTKHAFIEFFLKKIIKSKFSLNPLCNKFNSI